MAATDLALIAILGTATASMGMAAVWARNLLVAVVAYSLASAFLSALFFHLDSPFAGALELTVGAGLIAILFIVALILAGGEETEVPA
jgi:NADH:ubiquinone oxidoreductase subunit 6 (subunit J)